MTNRARERSVFATLGATNHGMFGREVDDYYATDPIALERLLETGEQFSNLVWECACGEGHLSKVLESHGYNVLSTDLIDRGYGTGGIDFLKDAGSFDGDIITNPPYKYAKEFVEKALDCITDGHRVAMFLKLTFLEGKKRRELFEKSPPPSVIYVASGRINCCKNGDFSKEQRENNSAVAYAWFIWDKPFSGDTVVKWFN